MTPPKARKATQAAPEPQNDPLADLREPDETPGAEALSADGTEDAPEDAVEVRPLVSQDLWDDLARESVVALHADTVALGFLHAGGACGCHYIAKTVLRHAVPVQRPEDLEPQDLDAPED